MMGLGYMSFFLSTGWKMYSSYWDFAHFQGSLLLVLGSIYLPIKISGSRTDPPMDRGHNKVMTVLRRDALVDILQDAVDGGRG